MAGYVIKTAGQEAGKVVITDGLAGRDAAVTKDDEGLAALHAIHLPGQRFEIGRRSHDRVGQARLVRALSKASFAC